MCGAVGQGGLSRRLRHKCEAAESEEEYKQHRKHLRFRDPIHEMNCLMRLISKNVDKNYQKLA